MIEIPLSRGLVALIDDIDADLLEYSWSASYQPNNGLYYAVRYSGKRANIIMHRVVLSRVLGYELLRIDFVDHIHGKTLDNRREELRLATGSTNKANQQKNKNNTSGYKGVTLVKSGKYVAHIGYKNKDLGLGYFFSAEDAARAYDVKAVELFGEFAKLNFKE